MAEYTVIKPFTDLQDNRHVYRAGDKYPRPGFSVSMERINALASSNNKRHEALIMLVEEPVYAEQPKAEYAKRDILRMPVAKLRKLAKEYGHADPDNFTGSELKSWLIDTMNL